MKYLGFLLGLSVAGSSFILPWWGTLLLIAGAWILGAVDDDSLGYGIGVGGTFPFFLLLILSGVDRDYGSHTLISLLGVTAMGGLVISSRGQPARG